MGEEVEEKPEAKNVRICITIPTKESVVEAIQKMFPTVKVEVEEETTEEE